MNRISKFFVILLVFILGFIATPTKAENLAILKKFMITELSNTIELTLSSDKHIQYNVINYMDGDIGIKLLNTFIDKNFNPKNSLTLSNQNDIDEVSILQDDANNIEIKFSGNSKLADKRINIHNEILKSNFILIEEKDNNPKNYLSVSEEETKNILSLDSIDTNQRVDIPQLNSPISMFSAERENNISAPPILEKTKKGTLKTQKLTTIENKVSQTLNTTKLMGHQDSIKHSEPIDNSTENIQKITKEKTLPEINEQITEIKIKDKLENILDKPDSKRLIANDIDDEKPEKTTKTEKDNKDKKGLLAFALKNWLWILLAVIGIVVVGFIILFFLAIKFGNFDLNALAQQYMNESKDQNTSEQPQVAVKESTPIVYTSPFQGSDQKTISEVIAKVISQRNINP